MSRRTLGTKGYGPVKYGNWGNGYTISNLYENYEKESCYTCSYCTEKKHCGRTGVPIPQLGKGTWKYCVYYEYIYGYKNSSKYVHENTNYVSKVPVVSNLKAKRKEKKKKNKVKIKNSKKIFNKKKKHSKEKKLVLNLLNLKKIELEFKNYLSQQDVDIDRMESYQYQYEQLSIKSKNSIDAQLIKDTKFNFYEWIYLLESKTEEYNKALKLNDNFFVLYSKYGKSQFDFINKIYANIFYICLKQNREFKDIIYQASYEIYDFQKDLMNIVDDKESVKDIFSPITFFIMYLSRICSLLSCKIEDLFVDYRKDCFQLLLVFLVSGTNLNDYPIKIKKEFNKHREFITFQYVFKEVEFSFKEKGKVRSLEINLLKMDYADLPDKIKNNLKILENNQIDKKGTLEKANVNLEKIKNSKTNEFKVVEGLESVYSSISHQNIEDGLKIYSTIACLALDKKIDFSKLIYDISEDIYFFTEDLNESLLNDKISVDNMYRNNFIMLYLCQIAEKLSCTVQDLFELSNNKRKDIIYKYLKDIHFYDLYKGESHLDISTENFSEVTFDVEHINNEYWVSLNVSFFECYFCYGDKTVFPGRSREFKIYSENRGQLINSFLKINKIKKKNKRGN